MTGSRRAASWGSGRNRWPSRRRSTSLRYARSRASGARRVRHQCGRSRDARPLLVVLAQAISERADASDAARGEAVVSEGGGMAVRPLSGGMRTAADRVVIDSSRRAEARRALARRMRRAAQPEFPARSTAVSKRSYSTGTAPRFPIGTPTQPPSGRSSRSCAVTLDLVVITGTHADNVDGQRKRAWRPGTALPLRQPWLRGVPRRRGGDRLIVRREATTRRCCA